MPQNRPFHRNKTAATQEFGQINPPSSLEILELGLRKAPIQIAVFEAAAQLDRLLVRQEAINVQGGEIMPGGLTKE